MRKSPPNQTGKKWKVKKPRSLQWRRLQSEAHKKLVGEKNARWLGGRRDYCVTKTREKYNNTKI